MQGQHEEFWSKMAEMISIWDSYSKRNLKRSKFFSLPQTTDLCALCVCRFRSFAPVSVSPVSLSFGCSGKTHTTTTTVPHECANVRHLNISTILKSGDSRAVFCCPQRVPRNNSNSIRDQRFKTIRLWVLRHEEALSYISTVTESPPILCFANQHRGAFG